MAIYFIIVFITHILQSITGFGSTSIGVPFLSLALGTEQAVLLLAPASAILCLFVLGGHYKMIQWRPLLLILASILPLMPLGFLLYARLRYMEWALRLIIGTLVSLIAGRELFRRLVRKKVQPPPVWATYLALAAGAVIEGMFSMGAALINFYAINQIRDKGAFRATMVSVWVMTNLVATSYRTFWLGAYEPSSWMAILYAVPLIGLAFFIGNKLHQRIPNQGFIYFVYGLQLVSGLISVAGGLILLLA